jgi:xylulokinase
MREYGIKFNEVRVVGGGAKSELWNQIKADVLNVDYITLLREEGAVMGTAVIAGYGVSLFKNIADTISEWVKVAGRTQPRLKYHEFYLRYYKIYEELHDNLYTLFNKLAEVVNIAPPN